ncbi:pyridoxamine 5'-phosphate oxidase family protein [Actinomycetospora termitidis]|uniref:Pyridoxamine 5'-phosphate oxidase family protein n=1 Tax=Actinomycetospora termitidis TaxID=3053470 RepID=A0ABT7M790_9PSEU|nr:pyridoxamine 5'-phosphate oxidase family protein [Actinomycetospora sp. Odt1-22]MDL5155907.1 pyridoxamine 5'-phosphate oxidase family protein [Actinomycetospora sp. Odt1-22]
MSEQITSLEQLRDVVGEPVRRAVVKQRDRLDETDRAFIARSPFQMIATAGADGSLDVSPKGDPAGSVHVLDDRTLAIPDRPGNRRVDGFTNILENPHVGLIFLVPRRHDTLRVNGTARLLLDPPYAEAMRHRRHVPRIVLEVAVEEVFTHCAKAFLRSDLWEPEAWPEDDLPSIAQMAARTTDDMTLPEMEAYYSEENTRSIMYGTTPP